MKEELLKGLSEEQVAKLKECKNQEEILQLAKEQGVELTNEQLEAVSGGGLCAPKCPNCGTKEYVFRGTTPQTDDKYVCKKCGAIVGNCGIQHN